ncbi:MAG: hypothetical protein HN348_11465 [Proteobacteria bacterium]|nr:hypothetical protein [Pseudomonadota bacterium]
MYRVAILLFLSFVACNPESGLSQYDTDAMELLGILISPESVLLPVGDEIQLQATGLTDDRSSSDVTAVVKWTSTDSSVAKVSDGLDEEGVVKGLSVGTAKITAIMDDVESVPLKVTVTDAELLGLSVEPGEVSVGHGDTVQLTASAAFSDGGHSDASVQVRWITADGDVAQLEGGLLTAVGQGSTNVVADWDGVKSNVVPVSVTKAAEPDLLVANIDVTDSTDFVLVEIELTNEGETGAADFWVDLFFDPSGEPSMGDLGEEYESVDYLGPGETTKVVMSIYDVDSGQHDIYVVVDTENDVEESNEGNNVLDTTVEVSGSAQMLPDLVIDDFSYIADDESLYYFIEVSNYSDEPAGDFFVDLWVDAYMPQGTGDEYQLVSGLDAWSTEVVEFLVDESCYGSCTSWVVLDVDDEIAEEDESDNEESLIVTTWEPDDDTGWWW